MKRQVTLWMVFLSILVGCSAPTTQPPSPAVLTDTPPPAFATPLPTQQPSQTLNPTRTLAPSLTPTLSLPTSTPLPFLKPTSAVPVALAGTPVALSGEVITPENVGQLVEVARWGKGRVADMVFSGQNDELIVGAGQGVYFYDSLTLDERRFLSTETAVTALALSSDGITLAISEVSGLVTLWDFENNLRLRSFAGKPHTISELMFSLDASKLIQVYTNADNDDPEDEIDVWEISTGKRVYNQTLNSIYVLPDGERFFNRRGIGPFELRNTTDGSLVQTFSGNIDMEYLAISPDNHTVATYDFGVELRNLEDLSLFGVLDRISKYWINDFSFAPACQISYDPFPAPSVEHLLFSPDGRSLAVFLRSGTIQIRSVSTGEIILTLPIRAIDAVFSRDSDELALLMEDGVIETWSLKDGTLQNILVEHPSRFYDLEVAPHRDFVAVGNYDGRTRVLSLTDGRRLYTLSKAGRAIAISPDEGTLVTSDLNTSLLQFWRLNDGSLIRSVEAPSVTDIVYSPDGRLLAVSSFDCTINVWNTQTETLIKVIATADRNNYLGPITDLDFSPDGNYLLASSWDGGPTVWRVSDWERLTFDATDLEYGVSTDAVAFSPSNQIAASGGYYGIQVFTWNNGRLEKLWNLDGTGRFLSFAPDGELLAGADLWRVDTGELIRRFAWEKAVFSSDGQMIISVNFDSTISVWSVQP